MATPQTDTPRPAGGVDEAALGMAMARAAEADAGCPLFDDPYAQRLLDAAEARGWPLPTGRVAERIRALSGYSASRTKWFDDFFVAAAGHGIEQSVMLAAGLDVRAWRLPWVSGSVVYEIDEADVLDFKAETLAADGARPGVSRYVAVPVGLSGDWPTALRDTEFDVDEPTAWAIEGLLPHVADGLFERIHDLSAPASRIAVEAVGTGVADWLKGRGWDVWTLDAQALMNRYDRCEPDASPMVPGTVFVEGHLLER